MATVIQFPRQRTHLTTGHHITGQVPARSAVSDATRSCIELGAKLEVLIDQLEMALTSLAAASTAETGDFAVDTRRKVAQLQMQLNGARRMLDATRHGPAD